MAGKDYAIGLLLTGMLVVGFIYTIPQGGLNHSPVAKAEAPKPPQVRRENFTGTPDELGRITIPVDGKTRNVADLLGSVHWEQTLGNLSKKEIGAADGRALLNDRVMLENAEETLDFIRQHGLKQVEGPRRVVRLNGQLLELEYELRGRDHQVMTLLLSTNGQILGGG